MKTFLIAVIVVIFALVLALRLFMYRLRRDYEQRRAIEMRTAEVADWFGKTGLDSEVERELPRYLRREFGEFIDQPGALLASSLTYLGAFDVPPGRVHFWQLPAGRDAEACYAYVEVGTDGNVCTGWGDRAPPLT